ncbi:M14 family metallopeptidase, partial [Cellulomonas cellasea]
MSYLNVAEIESALVNLHAAYPDTSELVTLPNPTHEGRRTHALRIGARRAGETDGILLLGGVHAREWVPPDALVAVAADLLEAHQLGTGLGYGGRSFTAEEVARVVEQVDVLVYPCVNPDGRHHSQTAAPMWRKNRRPSAGGGASCVGVDLNRNFDFLWDHTARFATDAGVATSADPCEPNTYRGPGSASEPETRNVVWLVDTHPRIRWHVDVHSAVPVILHSWGSDENQSTHPDQTFLNPAFDPVRGRPHDTAYGEYLAQDDLDRVRTLAGRMDEAIRAVRGDSYGVEQAYGLYPTSGASDDYLASRHRTDPRLAEIDAFTIECGHSFQPAWSEAEHVIREVSAGVVALALAAAASVTPDEPAVAVGGVNAVALVRQTPGWGSIPVAASNGDGTWTVTNGAAGPDFIPTWANQPGVRVVTGDFNGNGFTDVALVRQTPGWGSIPVAFANGDGTWAVTNGAAGPDFIPSWANQPGVRVVTGDFNGNGLTDIALVRQTPGWGSIPIAFANGDGTWTVTNGAAGPDFIPSWANQPGVKLVTGDFNGNGLTDIALVRQTPGWGSIPIAFANGDGTWTVTDGPAAPDFIPTWANQPGVKLVTGDFNGNGLTD